MISAIISGLPDNWYEPDLEEIVIASDALEQALADLWQNGASPLEIAGRIREVLTELTEEDEEAHGDSG